MKGGKKKAFPESLTEGLLKLYLKRSVEPGKIRLGSVRGNISLISPREKIGARRRSLNSGEVEIKSGITMAEGGLLDILDMGRKTIMWCRNEKT